MQPKASEMVSDSSTITTAPPTPAAMPAPKSTPTPRKVSAWISPRATMPASWPIISATRLQRGQGKPVEKAGLYVVGHVGAGAVGREERPLHEGDGERELEVGVRGEARDLRGRVEPARVDREEHQREHDRRHHHRRLAQGAYDRAAREHSDLQEQAGAHSGANGLGHAATGSSASASAGSAFSASPSSERPVFSRKTSSSVGACS